MHSIKAFAVIVTLNISGDQKGSREVSFRKPGEFILGRVESVHCHIDDPRVSKQHCALIIKGMEVKVRDLNSANGTKVDGVQLGAGDQDSTGDKSGDATAKIAIPRGAKKEISVHDGSIIEIGSTRVKIILALDQAERDKIARWAEQAEQKLIETAEICGHILDFEPQHAKAGE
ncbi:FHA domain-containing protein, partial [Candidatus Sumerlaeota bacterium]|nr:FHA domain-containing protein [Candidatus Sumerlaeota bacterium]